MATNVTLQDLVRARREPGAIREVALLAYPVALQTLAETIMQVINSAMVGRLGATELGAVGFGGIWLWTLQTPFFGTATGVQVFVARADGAQRPRECGPWVWVALCALVPATAVWMGLVGLGLEPLFALLGPSPELQGQAALYVYARLAGIPFLIAAVATTGFFRGLGDTRTPLLATLATVGLNVVLAYGLIFGRLGLPVWGVAGAGAAIAFAEVAQCGVLLALLLRRRVRASHATAPVWPDGDAVRRFLRTSAPIGGQWLLDMTSFALFTSIVARMGDIAMAASQAMIHLLSLSFMQAVAISIASGALVGRYIGAQNLVAADRTYRSAMKLAMLLAAAVAVLFLSAPELLMRVFTTDADVIALAGPLLMLGAFFQIVDAVGIVAAGSLRGGGDTRWPFLVQATLAWVVRLPLVYVAAVALRGGVVGAWLGELGYVFILGGAFVLRFRAGHWRSMQI